MDTVSESRRGAASVERSARAWQDGTCLPGAGSGKGTPGDMNKAGMRVPHGADVRPERRVQNTTKS